MTHEEAVAVVRAFEDAYERAFDRRDARALAALFLDDATILTEWGDLIRGRADFEAGLARAFAARPGESRLTNTPAHVAIVADGVIVTQGTSRRTLPPDGREDTLVYTRVLVRRNGEWRLAANQVAEPSAQPDPRAGEG